MAIKGYNAGVQDSNITPVIDQDIQKFNNGDMLFFDKERNVFAPGPAITQVTKLSELTNDTDFVTNPDMQSAIASALSGGTVDLTGYATTAEVQALIANFPTGNHFSGDYTDLTNKPTIPAFTSDITNNSGFVTTATITELLDDRIGNLYNFDGDYNNLTNLPTLFSGSYNDLTDQPNIFGGSYNDLTDTPTIPDTSNFLTETQIDSKISAIDLTLYATESYVDNQIANAVSGGTIDLSGYVTESELDTELLPYALKTELFSGSYNDLADKPTIPSITGLADETYVDDQVQLETVARQAADTAILNQIGAIVHFSGDYNDLTNKPTIPTVPTNVSDLTNDAGYITTSALPDLSNYALSSAIPDVSTFLSEAEIDQKIINVTGGSVDLSNYYTKAEVDGLITTPFSGNYNDLTNKPTIPAVPTLVSELTNDANYVTGNGLTVALQNYQPTVDLSLYALQTQLFDGDYNSLTNTPTIPAPVDVSNFLTETEIDSKIASAVTGGTVDLSDYVTDTELATQLANYQPTVDLTSYYTKTETDALIPSITDFLTETEIDSKIASAVTGGTVDLSDYVTESELTTALASAVSGGTVDLTGYATESYVDQKLVERGDHFSGNYNDLTNTPILFSGNYNDLLNRPAGNQDLRLELVGQELRLLNIEPEPDTVISTVDLASLGDAIAENIDYTDLANLPNLFSGDYTDLVNRPNLFSGDYNDLANQPYIPSIAGLASESYVNTQVNNPTINGTKTFTDDIIVEQAITVKHSLLAGHTAQKRMIALAVQTTDDTETEVRYSDGSAVVFDANSTIMLTATIVGAGVDIAENSAIIHKGIVTVNNTSATFVGQASQEIVSESQYNWTSNIVTDPTNTRELKLTVTGSNHTVNWTVFIEAHEVKI